MMQIPPIPSWDAIHPLLIHFPIVLLLLSPLFVLLAAVLPPARSRPYMTVALITLLLGTASLFLAASSGEEAAELADRGGGVDSVLATHEALASTCEAVFSAFSFILIVVFMWPRLSRRPQSRITTTAVPLVFLAMYCVGLVYLVNTAHAGGRLVHEFGVRAIASQGNEKPISSPNTTRPIEGD
jgi:uncharacterized membrane protein